MGLYPAQSHRVAYILLSLDYQGQRTADAMEAFAKSKLPNFLVTRVGKTGSTLEQFLEDRTELPHVLLVSNRGVTPPLWKALSTQYHNRLIFGETRAEGDSVADEAIEKTGATEFPTVIAYAANSSEPIKYEGWRK